MLRNLSDYLAFEPSCQRHGRNRVPLSLYTQSFVKRLQKNSYDNSP